MSRRLAWDMAERVPAAVLEASHRSMAMLTARDGVLRLLIATSPGDLVSIGCHHAAVTSTGDPEVVLAPRWTGGRVVPAGAGFVRVALALPHRSALVGEEPAALAAEQALNRCLRGVMAGLDGLGFPTIYPGRDLLTHAQRPFAMVTLGTPAAGGVLFESVIAVERDFAQLPFLLDRADPSGALPGTFWTPADVVSVGAAIAAPAPSRLAEAIVQGYARTFDLEPARVAVATDDTVAPALRTVPAALDRRATAASMLGTLDVRARIEAGRFVALRLCGDLIAPAATVASLEDALVGVPVAEAPVQAVLERVLADPDHYLLGAGTPAALAAAIAVVGR